MFIQYLDSNDFFILNVGAFGFPEINKLGAKWIGKYSIPLFIITSFRNSFKTPMKLKSNSGKG